MGKATSDHFLKGCVTEDAWFGLSVIGLGVRFFPWGLLGPTDLFVRLVKGPTIFGAPSVAF